MLKNAKDACATEALEIATYTALERLARAVGDDETAELAASIRADEEQMLARILREIPQAHRRRRRADVNGDLLRVTTGAADAARAPAKAASKARKTTPAKRQPRQARKVPGVAQAEGQVKGAVASEGDLAIARYDSLTADEITAGCAGLSQIDLAKVDAYERKHQNRTTILEPHHHPARRRAVGRATTSSPSPRSRPSWARATRTASSRSAPTSAPTRTAPASSRPPSASSRTRSQEPI